MCAVCGTVCCGFGGVSLCCVWDIFVWVWESECLLCVGQFCVGLVECGVLYVVEFCVGFGGMSV